MLKRMAKYIVFDGMDGSGKGTQLKLLEKRFGESVVFTREPGGPPLAEKLRGIVRDDQLAREATALFHFLGFWMAREETMHKLVMPALQAGKHVFSDRGDSSTFAFQIFGEQQRRLIKEYGNLRNLVFLAPGRRPPDLYVIFALPASVARERALADSARETNHFDVRDLAYYERVWEGFFKFKDHGPTVYIDANQSPAQVHLDVMDALRSRAGIECA